MKIYKNFVVYFDFTMTNSYAKINYKTLALLFIR